MATVASQECEDLPAVRPVDCITDDNESQGCSPLRRRRRYCLDDFVDLQQYPINNPCKQEYVALVARCRKDLEKTGACSLPNFLRTSALLELQKESGAVRPVATPVDRRRVAYSWMTGNQDFAPPHARSRTETESYWVNTADQLSQDGPLWNLFRFDELTDFVRNCLGFDCLYRCEDPCLALMVHTQELRDGLAWHFDTNESVVSICLQQCSAGGEFQYTPFIRSSEAENYDDVLAVMEGKQTAQVVHMEAGTFNLFRGHRSLHRVTAVTEGPQRIMALLSYDQQPGMIWSKEVRDRLSKKGCEDLLGRSS